MTKRWYEDRIPLSWGAMLEAAVFSLAGVAVAGAILAAVVWLTAK